MFDKNGGLILIHKKNHPQNDIYIKNKCDVSLESSVTISNVTILVQELTTIHKEFPYV